MSFEKTPLYIYKSGQSGDGAFLDPVSVLDAYETLSYTHGHYAPGSFELTTNKETSHVSDLIVGRILRIGEDDTKSVIINSITKTMDQTGNTILRVTGKETWSILERRVVLPSGAAYFTTTTTTPVETGIKTLIATYAGPAATVVGARLSKLNIVADGARGSAYAFSERFSNVLEAVSKALLATNSGLMVTLNHTTKKWDLDWTAGTDRTATVTLSSKFNTAQKATVSESDTALRNLVIAAGQGEGVNRNIRLLYNTTEPTDMDRREIFRDMRDLSTDSSIDQRAAQVLAEQSYTKTIEVSPLAYSRIVYGRDYAVGDKITFDELGTTQQAWITSATEQWKTGSYELKLGVDKAPATIGGQVNALSVAQSQALATTEFVNQQSVIMEYEPTISSSYALTPGRNGLSISPVLVGPGATVSVPSGRNWLVGIESESANPVIFPLKSQPSGNVTYTIQNTPGIFTICIPARFLIASSGGPFSLTITTWSGSIITVPIAASTDTIINGDLLFNVQIDDIGNLTSDDWWVSGSDSVGPYLKIPDGTKFTPFVEDSRITTGTVNRTETVLPLAVGQTAIINWALGITGGVNRTVTIAMPAGGTYQFAASIAPVGNTTNVLQNLVNPVQTSSFGVVAGGSTVGITVNSGLSQPVYGFCKRIS